MKFIFLLLIGVCVNLQMHGQNQLSGTVTNNKGEAILATLYLPQFEKGTVSDENGNYQLVQIPNGSYTLIISSLGYETISIRINFGGNIAVQKDFVMNQSVVEMEEVIISTPFHQLQSDNVMKVERVTTLNLTKSGAVNLSEGISNIAGVSTLSTGNSIGKPVIRGLSSNRVLTYTQGVRLENQQFGDEHGLGINGEGIESVEVIKGPASLLYGSDALGGVLYLNPEGFSNAGITSVSGSGAYFSNTEGYNTSMAVKTSGEKLKFMVRGTRNSFADYKTGDGQRLTNSRSNEYDLKTGIRYQLGKWKSTLRYNLNQSNLGLPEEIGLQSTDRDLLLPFQKIDNHIVSFENNLFFSNSSLNVTMGYLFNDRKEFEESTNEAALHMKLKTFNYDVKYHLPLMGAFETIVGVQGLFQNNGNYGEELLIPDASKTDFGIFTTTHYHLEKFDIQGGLRYDFRSIRSEAARNPSESDFIPALARDFNSFNVALGGKYDIADNWIARLNFASGFRAPNLSELLSNGIHEGTNRYEIGNPNLKNEQNFQSDLAVEYRSEHFEVYANGFYNPISNYIFIQPTGDIILEEPVFTYQQFNARLYGGEFGFHWHPHPLDWLHWESSYETVIGELSSGENLPLIPANEFKNTLRLEWKELGAFKDPYVFVTLQNTLNQNQTAAFEMETAGYNLLSLGLGSSNHLGKMRMNWGMSITNVMDETYIPHLSRLRMDGIANPGRSINLNLSLLL
jgi:iron complex outermembrane recepter protein